MNKNKFSTIFITLGIFSLLISCVVVSCNKLFWMDELITYYLVTDNSLLHMLHSIADQVDSSPPFYYIVLHFWALVFGSSELPLRLFSSLMMAGSFIVLFKSLRKVFGLYQTVIGIIVIFFINNSIFDLNSEARCYGLFLFEFSVLLYLYLEIILNNKKYYVLLSLMQMMFILTHPFGILYSLALMFSSLMYFFVTKINYRLIISSIAGFLLSAIYLPVFLNQIKVGDAHFWIHRPTIGNLLGGIIDDLIICPKWLTLIISLIGFLYFSNIIFKKVSTAIKNNSTVRDYDEKLFFYILSFTLVLMPIVVFVYSLLSTPIFVKRYMIISDIAWGLIAMTIMDNYKDIIIKKFALIKREKILQLILIGLVLAPIVASFYYRDPSRDEMFRDIQKTQAGNRLVLLSPHKYLPRYYYSNNKSSILFVLDETVAEAPNNTLNAYPDYKLMKALKRNYPSQGIVSTTYLIDSLKVFRVRNEKDRLWFDIRVVGNPNCEYSKVYKNVYEVRRKDSIVTRLNRKF